MLRKPTFYLKKFCIKREYVMNRISIIKFQFNVLKMWNISKLVEIDFNLSNIIVFENLFTYNNEDRNFKLDNIRCYREG